MLAIFITRTKNFFRLSGRALRVAYRRPARALLIARMATWLVLFTGCIKILSLPRALQMISPKVRRRPLAGDGKDLASAVDALLGVDAFIFRPICWKRSAILHRYLGLQGIDSRINFGLRKESDGSMSGHAWLERSGQAILESSPPDYTITYSFPSQSKQNQIAFPLET